MALSTNGAAWRSLLINLGGGMVTDLGVLLLITFKRGISYINIPTTLLSMVDASVGGKTGINFNGLKNEIGAFAPASSVLIETEFLRSLDTANFLSGYAEMLKHGLISDEVHWSELLSFDISAIDYGVLGKLVGQSVHIKGGRESRPSRTRHPKGLESGTYGRTCVRKRRLPKAAQYYGYAVAWGLVCELYLISSADSPKTKCGKWYNSQKATTESFSSLANNTKPYTHWWRDKKNSSTEHVNFTLLGEIGDIRINQTTSKKMIFEMLDFYRECIGI